MKNDVWYVLKMWFLLFSIAVASVCLIGGTVMMVHPVAHYDIRNIGAFLLIVPGVIVGWIMLAID